MIGVSFFLTTHRKQVNMVKRSEKLKQMIKSVLDKTYDLGVVGNPELS